VLGFSLSETTVSGNASAAVTFTSVAPVINSFSSMCPPTKGWNPGPGTICIDNSGNIASQYEALLYWNVVGATRYELYGAGGYLYYSGTATSVNLAGQLNHYFAGTWTLKAFNGSAVTIMYYNPRVIDITPPTPSG
jgi:hypothetical protein